MTLREVLAALPPGALVPAGWVLEMLDRPDTHPEPRHVTTKWLSEHEGLSAEWWAEQCRRQRIPGAWQERPGTADRPGSPWYLPLESAREYLLRRTNLAKTRTFKRRGPRKRRQAAGAP